MQMSSMGDIVNSYVLTLHWCQLTSYVHDEICFIAKF